MYILYNKKNKKALVHPQVGLWTVPTLKEAEELLAACHEYIAAIGMNHLIKDIIISTIEESRNNN